jgi:hypothetical protein
MYKWELNSQKVMIITIALVIKRNIKPWGLFNYINKNTDKV